MRKQSVQYYKRVFFAKFLATWQKFKFLFIIYIVFVIVWVPATIWFGAFKSYLCGGFHIDGEVLSGWFAAYTEDLIFFGTTGLIALIITTKLPSDEEFTIRIRALANSPFVGQCAASYLEEEVRKKLAFSHKYKVSVEVKRISTDRSYLYLGITRENEIMNMCKDVEIPLRIRSHVISDTDLPAEENCYVSLHTLVKKDAKGNLIGNEDPLPPGKIIELFKRPDGQYKHEGYYDVPENGRIIQKLIANIWNVANGKEDQPNSWLGIAITGYVENFELELKNSTQEEIKYRYKYTTRPGNGLKEELVNVDQILSKEIGFFSPNLQFYDGDRFDIFFKTEHPPKS